MSDLQEIRSSSYTVRIQDSPIILEDDVPRNTGGRVTFSGTVRPTENGKEIVEIFYESYREMAVGVLESIAKDAVSLYDVIHIFAVHRTGSVRTGEPSVVVDVFAEHRTEAFKACSLVIDRIKKEVPIWKKIVYSDGTERWKDEAGKTVEKGR